MSKKYLMFDLDDDKLNLITDVLSNKTSKRILEHLADKEASETEMSRDLNLPANTVNYNIKKLLEAGLIEKSKDWFWSVKGKKIVKYRVANRKIIISPITKNTKTILSILGAAILTGAAALVVRLLTGNIYTGSGDDLGVKSVSSDYIRGLVESAQEVPRVSNEIINSMSKMPEIWIWFLAGGIFALIVFMILNWRKL
ncbi:MAG: helix-turn-helix domain-containing protein [Candidatus Pacearchaeota archaeon]